MVDGPSYLWYLSKNIFKVECPRDSRFNPAAQPDRVSFDLVPDGYRVELLRGPKITETGNMIVHTNDEGLFWQRPAELAEAFGGRRRPQAG